MDVKTPVPAGLSELGSFQQVEEVIEKWAQRHRSISDRLRGCERPHGPRKPALSRTSVLKQTLEEEKQEKTGTRWKRWAHTLPIQRGFPKGDSSFIPVPQVGHTRAPQIWEA